LHLLVPGERQEDADAALLLQSRALEFVKKDGKFSFLTLGSLTRKMGMRFNDFNRSSMTSLFSIGAFLRRTWSAFRGFLALLIPQRAAVSFIKSPLF
jgi:hypothetical protein